MTEVRSRKSSPAVVGVPGSGRVDLSVDVHVSSDNGSMAIRTVRDGLCVEFPTLDDGLPFWKLARKDRSGNLDRIVQLFERAETALFVQVGDDIVASMGRGTRRRPLETLLGLGRVRIRWLSLARVLFRRRRR